jgi:hypothetical protein
MNPSKLILTLVDDDSNMVKHALLLINDTFQNDRQSAAMMLSQSPDRLVSAAFRGGGVAIFGDFSAMEEVLTKDEANDFGDHGAVVFTDPTFIACALADLEAGRLKTTSLDLADVRFDASGFQVSGVVKYDFTYIYSRHMPYSLLDGADEPSQNDAPQGHEVVLSFDDDSIVPNPRQTS